MSDPYLLPLDADEARLMVALFRFYVTMVKGTPTALELATGFMIVRSLHGRADMEVLCAKVAELQRELRRHGEG